MIGMYWLSFSVYKFSCPDWLLQYPCIAI